MLGSGCYPGIERGSWSATTGYTLNFLAPGRAGTVVADASYIRDKILAPDDHLIAGYRQVMPSFKGVIPEEDMTKLVAFIKRLGTDADHAGTEQTP